MDGWFCIALGMLIVALIAGQNFKLNAVARGVARINAKLDLLIHHAGESGTEAERQALMDKLNRLQTDIEGTIK